RILLDRRFVLALALFEQLGLLRRVGLGSRFLFALVRLVAIGNAVVVILDSFLLGSGGGHLLRWRRHPGRAGRGGEPGNREGEGEGENGGRGHETPRRAGTIPRPGLNRRVSRVPPASRRGAFRSKSDPRARRRSG